MNFGLKAGRLLCAAAIFAGNFSACTPPDVERICPALPQVRFTPDPERAYGVKDNVSVTLTPFQTEGGDFFACPAMVCFTVDGTEPREGRASTHCYPGPVKQIPIMRSTCFNYYVVGVDGSQSTAREVCYKVEPPPVSTCSPKSKASREAINVELTSNKEGTIFYTLDGSDPDPAGDSSGSTKSGSAKVSIKAEKSMTVKFRAQDSAGNLEEKTNSCDYKVDSKAPTTSVVPTGTASTSPFIATISSDEAATIYYTTDGSQPQPARLEPAGATQSEFFEAKVNISTSSYLRFYAIDGVGNEEDPIHEEVYFVGGKPAVGVDPGPGIFSETSIEVKLVAAPATPGDTVKIFYTTDGLDPTTNSTLYTGSITEFNAEGEYTLKYFAREFVGNTTAVRSTTAIFTVNYQLGVNAPPFYRSISFNDLSQVDPGSSTMDKVEVNTHKGIARVRRLKPVQVGLGVNSGTAELMQELKIVNNAGTHYLYSATTRSLTTYDISSLPTMTAGSPRVAPTTPCSIGANAGMFFLGLNTFVSADGNGKVGALIPFLTPLDGFLGQNCAGFAKWYFNTHPAAATQSTSNSNASQFNVPNETLNDAAEDPQNMPRTDAEIVRIGANDVLLLPRYVAGFYNLYGYAVSNNAEVLTPTTTFPGRPIAVAADSNSEIFMYPRGPVFAPARTAVGDASGTITILNGSFGFAASKEICTDCRINDISWFSISGKDFVLFAIAYYSDPATGQVGIAEIQPSGSFGTIFKRAALPATDDFVISAPVESVKVLPNNVAVAALRQQGIVYLNLTAVDSGTVSSYGYLTGADLKTNGAGDPDPYFFANDIAVFPAVVPAGAGWSNRFAVVDDGHLNTAYSTGFQIFEKPANYAQWETSGTLLTTNFNNSGKRISRVQLSIVTDGSEAPVMPDGVTIQLVADGAVQAQPIILNTGLTFTAPALDVRAKLTFQRETSNPNTTIAISHLQFKLTPVE